MNGFVTMNVTIAENSPKIAATTADKSVIIWVKVAVAVIYLLS